MTREINILLLGETGAGKSTTLNAIANYLKYSSFEEANSPESSFSEVIPSQFTLPDPITKKMIVIKSDRTDTNERHGSGNSVTQAPVGYLFTFGDRTIRIIDTPGIGDTEGAENDRKNFDKILTFLQMHSALSAVVFIVKGSDSRKTPFFRYCISELLTHLHRSITRNMIFLFTFSRNSMYGVGEGYSTLEGFLKEELKETDLSLTPGENSFFIDNEAYRYLVAKKCGYQFKKIQELGYQESWENSVEQIVAMFEHIISLPPHSLEKTISLNSARKIITDLAQPMVQLQSNMMEKIRHIEAQKCKLEDKTQSKEELAKSLTFEVYDLEMRELSYPSTVCAAKRCVKVIRTQEGEEKVSYQQRCHEDCKCFWVTHNLKGQKMLTMCEAMDWSFECRKCGCSWDQHMHITCEYIKIKKTVIDVEVQQKINNTEDVIVQIDDAIKQAKKLVEEYKEEEAIIEDVSSKFAYILSTNSYFTHNRYFEQYLDFLIDEENKKPHPKTANLRKMKADHQEKVAKLTAAIKKGHQGNVTIEDVPLYRDRLLNLKHSGATFRQMLQTTHGIQKKKKKAHSEHKVLELTDRSSGQFSSLIRKLKKLWH